jgi:hypothetical protein
MVWSALSFSAGETVASSLPSSLSGPAVKVFEHGDKAGDEGDGEANDPDESGDVHLRLSFDARYLRASRTSTAVGAR